VKWGRVVLDWNWRAIANCTWWLLGVWTVLAVFYTAPGPSGSRTFWQQYLPSALSTWTPVKSGRWNKTASQSTIDGDEVHIQNVRNFTWRTATDYDIGWYKRIYDLTKLNSMHYIVAPMRHWEAVASVFVSFGFSDGQQVANPWRDIDSTAALTASSRQCSVSFN
jgi:hypothetical protein